MRPYLVYVVSFPDGGASNFCEAKNNLLLIQNKEHMCKMPSGLPDFSEVIHVIKGPGLFPLHFCILQAIKNQTVGRPGNEATVHVCEIETAPAHEDCGCL